MSSRLVSILPCRNEEDILGFSLRALLQWVDHVCLLLHASTDRSAEIARAIAAESGRVTILSEPDSDWHEMAHRQELLLAARDAGATHIVMLVADELLTANLLPSIRGRVESLPTGTVLGLPGYNPPTGPGRY